jgi:ankyrin repeat protein
MGSQARVVLVLLAVGALFGLQACTNKYRQEIDTRGIPYTADSFFTALTSKNDDVAGLFIQSGFDVNVCKIAPAGWENNENAMYFAVYHNNLAIARQLLAKGYTPNKEQCKMKTPPLHFAAMRGLEDMARLLVEAGADVNRKDMFGLTPLALAESMHHPAVAAYLRSKGAR